MGISPTSEAAAEKREAVPDPDIEGADSSPRPGQELLQERLHMGETSFALEMPQTAAGASTPKPGNDAAEKEPQGKWYHAVYHTVTAVVGVGVLGLPYAFSYLGWTGGLLFLGLCFMTSLYTSYLLAALHEGPDGTRRNRYKDLGQAILGRKLGLWLTAPCQWSVMFGLAITYTVTAGQSFQGIHDPSCSGHTEGAQDISSPNDKCHLHLTGFIILFGAIQACLSQLKDFHSLWWASLVGAAMSMMYSAIAFFASAATHRDGASYSARPGTPADLAFGVANSLGTIMFAYGGQVVLLEIQATLGRPPSTAVSMMKSVYLAYVVVLLAYFPVAISGYGVFGNSVNPDVLLSISNPRALISIANFMVVLHLTASYQVFAQPLFELVESLFYKKQWPLWQRPQVLRLIVRTCYVILSTVLAICLPFFADLMGLIGAAGFVPLCFVLPSVFWIKEKQPRGVELALNLAIIFVFALLGIIAGVGSIRQIILHSSQIKPMPALFALYIINKSGGLIYNKEFLPMAGLNLNDTLRLASIWHSLHAIASQLSPVPDCTGMELLQADSFDLHCFQTLTGTKFLMVAEPNTPDVREMLHDMVYNLYTDYVLKNPFYEVEMPIRCELFDTNLFTSVSNVHRRWGLTRI